MAGFCMKTSTVQATLLPSGHSEERIMTLCPVAIVAGCKKCPVFGVCPLKGVIGDHVPEKLPPPEAVVEVKGEGKQGQ